MSPLGSSFCPMCVWCQCCKSRKYSGRQLGTYATCTCVSVQGSLAWRLPINRCQVTMLSFVPLLPSPVLSYLPSSTAAIFNCIYRLSSPYGPICLDGQKLRLLSNLPCLFYATIVSKALNQCGS